MGKRDLRKIWSTGALVVFCAVFMLSWNAAPLGAAFTQCPPVGVNTGCQFLITISAAGVATVQQDTVAPNNGPYDGVEDALVGVQNNSSVTVTTLPLSSPANSAGGIFAFDGDGPCTQSVAPAGCPFTQDPNGYGGPGVTFINIASNNMSGTVRFTPGIAPGGSAWFALEENLSSSTITPGTPNGGAPGVPAPPTVILLLTGVAGLVLYQTRHRLARLFA